MFPLSIGAMTGLSNWRRSRLPAVVEITITVPFAAVTRAQMAVFLLRSKYGGNYIPPAARGVQCLGMCRLVIGVHPGLKLWRQKK